MMGSGVRVPASALSVRGAALGQVARDLVWGPLEEGERPTSRIALADGEQRPLRCASGHRDPEADEHALDTRRAVAIEVPHEVGRHRLKEGEPGRLEHDLA